MLRPRIIPCLLVHNGGLAKTTQFSEHKYVGDPINAVKIFNEKEVDELIVVDIDASRQGREPDYRLIELLAQECRMPLCYGGGVRTPEQANRIISLGVEKVGISTFAIANSALVSKVANQIGSQSVVVVLDVRNGGGGSTVWTSNGTTDTGIGVIEMVERMQEAGAGEIVINDIARDGMMRGYNLDLAQQVRAVCRVPLTMLGGAGKLSDIERLIEACGVIGAAAGSMFVFKGIYRAVLISYPKLELRDQAIRSGLGAAPQI